MEGKLISVYLQSKYINHQQAGTGAGTTDFSARGKAFLFRAVRAPLQLRPGAPDPSDHAVSGEPTVLIKAYENRHFVTHLAFSVCPTSISQKRWVRP